MNAHCYTDNKPWSSETMTGNDCAASTENDETTIDSSRSVPTAVILERSTISKIGWSSSSHVLRSEFCKVFYGVLDVFSIVQLWKKISVWKVSGERTKVSCYISINWQSVVRVSWYRLRLLFPHRNIANYFLICIPSVLSTRSKNKGETYFVPLSIFLQWT